MARVSMPAQNVRSMLAKLAGLKPAPERATFQREFDGTNAVQILPAGWKPVAVYLDGLRQFEGASDDCTVSFNGFLYSVTWAVTPANTSACHIDAERQP